MPSPSPASPPVRSPLSRAGLVVRVAVTVVAALAAAELGVLASVFGLVWVVPVAAVLALAVAATLWRRRALPVAVMVCAACVPAALAHTDPVRIAPGSTGAQIVVPASVADLAPSYRRGLGPLLIDLRTAQLPRGATISLSARSDTGHVVVALPQDRCINVTVRYTRLPHPGRLTSEALRAVSLQPGSDAAGFPVIDFFSRELSGTADGVALVLFGRIHPGSASQTVVTRRAVGADAVDLTLDVASPGTVVVRDFPDRLGPVNGWLSTSTFDDQGRGQPFATAWPWELVPPNPPPSEVSPGDRWMQPWTAAQVRDGTPGRWARWLKGIVPWQRAVAQSAAGPCAPPSVRATYWTRQDVDLGGGRRVLWVNGVGASEWNTELPDGTLRPAAPLTVDDPG